MLAKQVLAATDLSTIYAPAGALGGRNATLDKLINPLIANVFVISGLFAFGVILMSGFMYISASGDKGKIQQAGHMLNYGILGLVVIVSAFVITRLVGKLLGFNFF